MFLKGRGRGEGGGHTLERMNPPPGRKKKSFSGKRRRGEGGLWLWFMTSKLSQKMFFVRVSDPGVAGAEPRDAHDLTGRDIMPVSALTPPAPRTVEETHETKKKIQPGTVFRTTDRGRQRDRRGLRGGSSSRLKERRGAGGSERGGGREGG